MRLTTDLGYGPQLQTKHTSSKTTDGEQATGFQAGNDFRRAPLHASKAHRALCKDWSQLRTAGN